MFEYGSVSASAYDVNSLVGKLNEKAAEGWEVVSIVPPGGDVTAFLKRQGNGAGSPFAASSAGSAGSAGSSSAPSTTGATGPLALEAVSEPDADQDRGPQGGGTPIAEPAGWASAPDQGNPRGSDVVTPIGASSMSGSPSQGNGPSSAPQPAPQPTPQPAPVVTTPAGWYPDPSGRFEMRYWDGDKWTEHVSRAGQTYTDPPVA
jgi:hypothetical protein